MFKKTVRTTNSRRHKRLKANYLLKYGTEEGPNEFQVTNIKDISAGGVRFTTREPLPEGARVMLSILIPPLDKEIKAMTKILRTRSIRDKGFYYDAGVFENLNAKDQADINEFIEYLATTEDAPFLIDQHPVVRRKRQSAKAS